MNAASRGSAQLTIDLGALAANWRMLRDRAVASECAAVVKADAYGIGLEPAVGALTEAGCRTFFVAHLGEAERARRTAPDALVYVFNGLAPGSSSAFEKVGARPVLGSWDEIQEWAAHCRDVGRHLPAAIHVDTGMNRLGLALSAAEKHAGSPLFQGFEAALLMSHFVGSEDPAEPSTAQQMLAFARLSGAFPGVPTSLANSSGLFLDGMTVLKTALARPGYALYGGNPSPSRANPMRPVVRLEAPIIQIRDVPFGARVGYNGRWTARRQSRLATLSVGYADGYLRSLSSLDGPGDAGAVLVADRPCPVVGRISMDLTVVDVTDVPEADAQRGSRATLIGDALDVDEVGRRAGTIGYEILTSLGSRYERLYVS